MGNCISKINKDYLYTFEEIVKNDIFFSKGKTRSNLEMYTRGKGYTGFHSIRKIPEIINLAPLQTGM